MKKILLTTGVFVLLGLSTNVFAQGVDIFIPTVKTDKTSYTQSETIMGELEIDNNYSSRQSDLYIETALVDENKVSYDRQIHQIGLYLEAKSRRKIQFEHAVNADINGRAELVVSAYLANGALVGQKRTPININNSNIKETILFDQKYIIVNEDKFPLQVGPTISKTDSISISFNTKDLPAENISVQPKIELYNRTTVEKKPIETLSLDHIILQSNKQYSLDLPNDLLPLVYEGKLSFSIDTDAYTILPIYFRYIVDGPIGTILNANASILNVNKDESVQIKIEYAGSPVNINRETEAEIDNNENFDPTQELNSDQAQVKNATIKIILQDKDGDVIGERHVGVSLSEMGTIVEDIIINKKVKGFSIKAEMIYEDGTVLSTYQTELPSEEDLKNAYGTQKNELMNILISFLIIILIITFLVIKKKKNIKSFLVAVLVLFGGVFLSMNHAEAYTIHHNSLFAPFKLNAIFSPGPSESISYAPGEAFNLSISASYVACSNSGFLNEVYGPSDDWESFSIEGMYDVFWFQWAYGNRSHHSNIISWPDQQYLPFAKSYALPRFREWWTSSKSTILPSLPDNMIIGNEHTYSPSMYIGKGDRWYHWGFLTRPEPSAPAVVTNPWERGSTVYTPYELAWVVPPGERYGIGGKKLFETSSYNETTGYYSGHDYTTTYTIPTNYVYHMPQEPGFHDFYFMLINDSGGSYLSSTMVVSQKVCVRGAGVCPGEDEPGICPNLTGTYTQTPEDVIVDPNGNNTDLIIDESGDCVAPPPVVTPDPLTLSCALSESPVAPGTPVTFTAGNTGATSAITYTWIDDFDNSTHTGSPFTKTFSLGTHNVSLTGSTTDQLKTISCPSLFVQNKTSCPPTGHTDGEIIENPVGTCTQWYCATGDAWTSRSVSCSPVIGSCPPPGHTDGEIVGPDASGTCTQQSCVAGVWTPTPVICPLTGTDPIATFSFDPSVVGTQADFCGLNLTASNISSCTLLSPSGDINLAPYKSGNTFNLNRLMDIVEVGRYTLSCASPSIPSVTKFFGTKTCLLNPDLRER